MEIINRIIKVEGSEEGVKEGTPRCSIKSGSVSVLPIIGMGGVGKTTVAKMVFDDEEIKQCFDLRVWVCVSEDFRKTRVITEIINCIYRLQGKKETTKWTSLQLLEAELVELIEGKRVFLVLDDVWNDEMEQWEKLLETFTVACSNKGGCIITFVTTRLSTIAKAIQGCMEPIHFKGLEEEEFWEVFKLYAFGTNNLEGNKRRELEPTGRSIAKRLKGLPLAAKFIGALLTLDYSVKYWNGILASDLCTLELKKAGTIQFLPILRLSYDHLPRHLKQCLIYFSLFPKDYVFEEYEIIHIWMANNAIMCERVDEVEDVGREYLDFLESRSFLELQEEPDKYSGHFESSLKTYYGQPIKMYTMHDLIHDLIRSVKYDCELVSDTDNIGEVATSIRHLSFCNVYDFAPKVPKLRTMMFVSRGSIPFHYWENSHADIVKDLSSYMRCLRTLVLRRCDIECLPESIDNLKHLRLLDLSFNDNMARLPDSIGSLHNLQVLNLYRKFSYDTELECLPSTLTRLVNLRHLICDRGIVSQLKRIGSLSSLQRLDLFAVGDENGHGLNELEQLNMLHGRLDIYNLERVRSKEEAQKARLYKKTHLRHLKLSWPHVRKPTKLDEAVLEALKPCKLLEGIRINRYMGRKLPNWFNDSWLCSLGRLELWLSEYLEILPSSLCKMRCLKYLQIFSFSRMKEMKWPQGDGDMFPALETLYIQYFPELVGWRIEEDGGLKQQSEENAMILRQLKLLTLEGCPKLKCFAVRAPVLEELTLEKLPPVAFSDGVGDRSFARFEARTSNTGRGKQVALPSTGTTAFLPLHINNEPFSGFRFSSWYDGLASVKKLKIWSCSEITSCHLPVTMTSLEILSIQDCPKLSSCHLPPAPTALKELRIRNCREIISVYLISPVLAVDLLAIDNCQKIGSHLHTSFSTPSSLTVPELSLSTRSVRPRQLEIMRSNGKQLARLLHGIDPTNLKKLEIRECFDIEHFNDDFGDDHLRISSALLQLTSLASFEIQGCPLLQSLPPNISTQLLSLEEISLWDCPLLSSLPDLHTLTSLRSLNISGCPKLVNKHKIHETTRETT